ncbi:MAG: DUF4407 domain-containing protein [Actinomycetia bacterium]|nr:DUF4407 domain-containing protein [Actinomycetes bacterium]
MTDRGDTAESRLPNDEGRTRPDFDDTLDPTGPLADGDLADDIELIDSVVVIAEEGAGPRIGRMLRSCAGVDETLLRQVWPVRHRYTGLGGIVLGTAVAAAVSMALAISLTSDGLSWYFLWAPLLWGLLVFNLDRWLVSSTHGAGRPWRLFPRLVIAVLFGIIIAEPVVLWVFRDAIEERILDERADEIALSVSRLTECNPEDDLRAAAELAANPDCEGFIVDRLIPAPLGSAVGSRQVARLEAELTTLDARLEPIEAALTDARDRYQREIRGEDSGDTSGLRGEGPIAQAISGEIASLEGDQREILEDRDEVLTQLTTLHASLDGEQTVLREAQRELEQEYREATSEAVTTRIAGVQARNGDSIGLLQRFDALAGLAADHAHIFLARWLLTLFLVAVDSMPVIAKGIGGKTAYDNIYSRSLAVAERRSRHSDQFAEQEYAKRIELAHFRRSLRRTVARKRAVVRATRSIFGLDDELEVIHVDRDLPWERRVWDFADGETPFRPVAPRPSPPASAPPFPPPPSPATPATTQQTGPMPGSPEEEPTQPIDLRDTPAPAEASFDRSPAAPVPDQADQTSTATATLDGSRPTSSTTIIRPPTDGSNWLSKLQHREQD